VRAKTQWHSPNPHRISPITEFFNSHAWLQQLAVGVGDEEDFSLLELRVLRLGLIQD
jgi:hypothetical protein